MALSILQIEIAPQWSLRLSFERRNDRYGHRVETLHDGRVSTWLASIEGEPDDDWPPSPPLQQLSIETLPDGVTAALLVGMAGKSHWSLSAHGDPQQGGFWFDAACRVRHVPQRLGASYEPVSPHESIAGRALELRPLPYPETPLKQEEFAIGVETPDSIEKPQTIRWKYWLGLEKEG